MIYNYDIFVQLFYFTYEKLEEENVFYGYYNILLLYLACEP